jgi:hypothetical protein
VCDVKVDGRYIKKKLNKLYNTIHMFTNSNPYTLGYIKYTQQWLGAGNAYLQLYWIVPTKRKVKQSQPFSVAPRWC